MTQWRCPIIKSDYQMCDNATFYIVDGTALCRDHARDAIAKRERLASFPPPGPVARA